LSTRMIDSALNNVGTYGVRFDVEMNLSGGGAHELVLSHPVASGRKPFTAFRGSIGIKSQEGYREVHVGMKSGQSLPLGQINVQANAVNPVTISVVYPADATPGHLLSVVPVTQLAVLRRREELLEAARKAEAAAKKRKVVPPTPPPAINAQPNPPKAKDNKPNPIIRSPRPVATPRTTPKPAPRIQPSTIAAPSSGANQLPAAMIMPQRVNDSLEQRYRDAIKAQQDWLRRLQGR
ncbi:MAG: DUF3370 family protein, partial [Cyanobacteria bacterium]|nr:DUF3370 family protein [Cyanobacteriota bacterium]